MAEFLQQVRRDADVPVGVATSTGVEWTARSAYDLGYNVALVTVAVTDVNAEMHRHSLEKVFPRLGETAATEDMMKAAGGALNAA